MGMMSEIATEATIKRFVTEIRTELDSNPSPQAAAALRKMGRFALTQFEWDTPEWAAEYATRFQDVPAEPPRVHLLINNNPRLLYKDKWRVFTSFDTCVAEARKLGFDEGGFAPFVSPTPTPGVLVQVKYGDVDLGVITVEVEDAA